MTLHCQHASFKFLSSPFKFHPQYQLHIQPSILSNNRHHFRPLLQHHLLHLPRLLLRFRCQFLILFPFQLPGTHSSPLTQAVLTADSMKNRNKEQPSQVTNVSIAAFSLQEEWDGRCSYNGVRLANCLLLLKEPDWKYWEHLIWWSTNEALFFGIIPLFLLIRDNLNFKLHKTLWVTSKKLRITSDALTQYVTFFSNH